MISFNEYGLLPAGIYEMTLSEFRETFAFNEHRKDMIDQGLIPFIGEIKAFGPAILYLDGSFVTSKQNPGDIDGYAVTVTGSDFFEFIAGHQDRWHASYRMDINAAFSDLEGECSESWWEDHFSQVQGGSGLKKGLIALKLAA